METASLLCVFNKTRTWEVIELEQGLIANKYTQSILNAPDYKKINICFHFLFPIATIVHKPSGFEGFSQKDPHARRPNRTCWLCWEAFKTSVLLPTRAMPKCLLYEHSRTTSIDRTKTNLLFNLPLNIMDEAREELPYFDSKDVSVFKGQSKCT